MTWWPFILGAFLVGSVPFGYLIGRAHGVDLRTVGSKNIGATNLGRALGRRYFFVCFFLDLLKGLIPTAVAGWRAGLLGEIVVPADQAWGWLAVFAAAVLGHMYTPWLGFQGGKGVATGLGAMLGMFPALTLPGVATLTVFVVVLSLWRYVSAASVTAALSLPFWTWYAHGQFQTLRERDGVARLTPAQRLDPTIPNEMPYAGWPFVMVAGVLGALVIYRHRGNIQRLIAGTEPKIGTRTPKPAASSAGVGVDAPAATTESPITESPITDNPTTDDPTTDNPPKE
jgi:glycerol-3-phosphate acyltransferase PlsY